MLDDFFTSPLSTDRSLMNDSFKLDIKDKEDKYVVKADIPGVNKEDIKSKLEDGVLCVDSPKGEEKEKTKKY